LLDIDTAYLPRPFAALSDTGPCHPIAAAQVNAAFTGDLSACAHVVVVVCLIVPRSGSFEIIDMILTLVAYRTLFIRRLEFCFQPVVFVLFYLYACRFE